MNARGGSKVQLILGLLVTAGIIVAAVRLVPVYANSFEFRDAIRSQAKFADVERKTPEAIRETLYKKAQDLSLPVTREQIQVTPQRTGVQIIVRYKVPVDLIVYRPVLNFSYSEDTAHAF